MVQRLICCLSCMSLSVSVAIGSDRPSKTAPNSPPPANQPSVPVAPASLPQVEKKLTPVQHLRRAADHLDAAAVGKMADTMHQQASELRDAAQQLESQLSVRLDELRQKAAEIQQEIQELEATQQAQEQLEVDFKVVEIDLAQLEQLGFEWEAILSNENDGIVQAGATSDMPTMLDTIPSQTVKGFLDALISEGAARVISDISMKLSSGRPATCLRGGEFPIPMPSGNGAVHIEWRTYGTRIEVLAEVLENGKLRLDVAPEYTWRDFTNAVTIEGMVIPGITTTRFNTQVEMEFGQTLLLSGQMPPESRERIKRTQAIRIAKGVTTEDNSSRKPLIVLATPRRLDPAQD